jgi:hypothetical protein
MLWLSYSWFVNSFRSILIVIHNTINHYQSTLSINTINISILESGTLDYEYISRLLL